MSFTATLPKQRPFGATSRPDAWWVQPLFVFLGFSAFIVYSTWAAFQGLDSTHCYYWYGGKGANYISPFYSPDLFGYPVHPGIFGVVPSWWPGWIPYSPAFIILWVPAGFRLTCYYYRGAYYKAFWADPINCAVGEPRKTYWGEHYLPLIIQNCHRYFLYLGLIFILILTYDAWLAMWFTDDAGIAHFGIAVGTLVLVVNVVLLAGYTFGCHALRHLIGGFLDEPSKVSACAKGYACVSCLNHRHMLWAWLSLFWVGFTDVYIRLCAMGIWHDFRFFTF
ncbi:MAG: hypothetical protein LV481_08485 [Methylacidiphilales bacterium]|nr:hypothetical protein [Candidatus Methylacidiphilales bacterium]